MNVLAKEVKGRFCVKCVHCVDPKADPVFMECSLGNDAEGYKGMVDPLTGKQAVPSTLSCIGCREDEGVCGPLGLAFKLKGGKKK
jgi:hypothetical protein